MRSEQHGEGTVIVDNGPTVVVRFEGGIHECDKKSLAGMLDPIAAAEAGQWGDPRQVVLRLQAESIRSVNDVWGVFTRSKINLLPHQLWVCRRVIAEMPARWLVADDVGLGKTIEAGLILMALASRGQLGRVLIVCPASLVEQWQHRMLEMFDVRAARYMSELDTAKGNFWLIHDRVIASLQTLRINHKGRQDRFFEADPWDVVIVDEAHHLNADEERGPTLGYKLFTQMVAKRSAKSMVFFTGTPHRGKNYGFLSLVKLLRPDLFDPSRSIRSQMPSLAKVMIRNNKYTVTDLAGNRLFKKPIVEAEEFSFSALEEAFYNMLTQFILTGQAYASKMSDSTQGRAVVLVLISMQKLASSSVAAIRRAIRGRLGRIRDARRELGKLESLKADLRGVVEADDCGDFDHLNQLEEQIAEASASLSLAEDEEQKLGELLAAAEAVKQETKIIKLINRVKEQYDGRSVLFFTEYKATQSLLMSALMKEFGKDTVTFINGDERADEVVCSPGDKSRSISESRESAADRFNSGQVRFLVSTEAAGEGVDLQENCHTLVHVDLPWNPMRMHQRVGRLNRIGQTQTVEVLVVHNPRTVESMIWQKLDTKINEINAAMVNVMDAPEDLGSLVLGMAPSSTYRDLFTEASKVSRERLDGWFDQQTSTFAGQDAVDLAKEMVGNCAKFDFHQASEQLPRVDLPDLRPFLVSALLHNHRRPTVEDGCLSFKTPDAWKDDPAIRASYDDLLFNRKAASRDKRAQVAGLGHPIVDEAMRQALTFDRAITCLPAASLSEPLLIYRITEKVTGRDAWVNGITAAVCVDRTSGQCELLSDWQLLQLLNRLKIPASDQPAAVGDEDFANCSGQALAFLESKLAELPATFEYPRLQLIGMIWPC